MDERTRKIALIAKQILVGVERFRDVSAGHLETPAWIIGMPRAEGELLIGWYENPPDDTKDSVVITNRGVYVSRAGEWERTPYGEISDIRLVFDDAAGKTWDLRKRGAEGIVVRLTDGAIRVIPACGGHGMVSHGYPKYRDAYVMHRFLRKAQRLFRRKEET